MKVYKENEIVPIHIILNSQDEIDVMWAIFSNVSIMKALGIHKDKRFDELIDFLEKGSNISTRPCLFPAYKFS